MIAGKGSELSDRSQWFSAMYHSFHSCGQYDICVHDCLGALELMFVLEYKRKYASTLAPYVQRTSWFG